MDVSVKIFWGKSLLPETYKPGVVDDIIPKEFLPFSLKWEKLKRREKKLNKPNYYFGEAFSASNGLIN